jgi:hypothetical protein
MKQMNKLLHPWFSTFFSCRHTKHKKKNFTAHLDWEFFDKHLEKELILQITPKTSWNICKINLKKLAAHMEEMYGTLLCRGTPVEKHCITWTNLLVRKKMYVFAKDKGCLQHWRTMFVLSNKFFWLQLHLN